MRVRGALAAGLAAAVAGTLSAVAGAQQFGPVYPASACTQVKDYAAFHRCALEAIGRFEPARTPDGRPDMRGLWIGSGLAFDLEEFTPTQYGPEGAPANPAGGKSHIVDPPDGRIPYHPWIRDIKPHFIDVYIPPATGCFQFGPQRFFLLGQFLIHQQKDVIVFTTERYHGHRIVPLDGRPHLGSAFALWMGDSRGRWEGDTLVVETRNLNGLTWFDQVGNVLSANATLEERFTFIDANTIHHQETITDPAAFTRPWTIAHALQRSALKGREAEIWYEDNVENCSDALQSQFNLKKRWWPGLHGLAPWAVPDRSTP
ncbi:MAG: hypothetical protein FJW23_15230 [Acidimicrobiia bacterium]|nr:hypothetical protein [Acidimicrobiia bacterium]